MTTLAFAGAGHITVVHALVAKALGWRVTHIASRTPERAAERAQQTGAVACSYDELPAGADIVVVATPPARHVNDAVRALDRGAAVIVEKPIATTLEDADRLVDVAAAHGNRLGYAENLLFAPVVARALDLVGGIGPLVDLEVRSIQGRPDWGDFLDGSWGGGALFDLGVHPIALALEAASPARATAVSARITGAPDIAVDEHAELVVRFDSGLRARVVASWGSDEVTWDLQAASAAGVVRAELLPELTLEHDGEPVELPEVCRAVVDLPQLEQFGYVDQLRRFAEDFANGRAPSSGAEFARSILDIVCAAYASAGHDGRPEAVPFRGPRDRTPLELWRG